MKSVRDFPDACLTHDQHLHHSGTFVLTAEPTSTCHHSPECRVVLGFHHLLVAHIQQLNLWELCSLDSPEMMHMGLMAGREFTLIT